MQKYILLVNRQYLIKFCWSTSRTRVIPRQLQNRIEGALFQGKTVVLLGPRQVGKTTLAKALLEKHRDGSVRGAKPFQAGYPGSTVEIVGPHNVWDFAGVPGKRT
jgi:ATPase subunit of ABC transporter with duplicated ATPase domains